MSDNRFDIVFEGPDDELVLDLVGRIEGPTWKPEQIATVSEPEAHLLRLCRFDGIFGNGGLAYWIECDLEEDCREMCAALHVIELDDAAAALSHAYDILSTGHAASSRATRLAGLARHAAELEPIEARLWKAHGEIAERTAMYARQNKGAFEHLRETRPWCPTTETFGEA